MNNIPGRFVPTMSLIAYESDNGDFYIERRRIVKRHNEFVMGSGAPLTKQTIRRIFNYANDVGINEMSFKSMVPENVLHVGYQSDKFSIIWLCESQKQNLNFKESLGIPNGAGIPPHLIFKFDQNLSVVAVKSKSISLDTPIYKAPFHNIYDNHNICMGNAKFKFDDHYFEDVMKRCEAAFFGSEFTHLNGDHNRVQGNINLIWKNLIDSNKVFPNNSLIRRNINVGSKTKPETFKNFLYGR